MIIQNKGVHFCDISSFVIEELGPFFFDEELKPIETFWITENMVQSHG